MTQQTNRPQLVIYHGKCRDGFCSAWVAHRYFSSLRMSKVLFHEAHYGTPPPECISKDVWILDFSYTREQMEKIYSEAWSLTVLDHHATAYEALRGLPGDVHFDMSRSGAGMTWDRLFPHEKRSWLVDYVEDRDLWRHALPHSRSVNAFIGTFPFGFGVWSDHHDGGLNDYVVDRGDAVLRKIDQYCRETGTNTLHVHYEEWRVPIVNASQCDISELLHYLLMRERPAFVIGWSQRHDGRFQYSLRSEGNFDVSKIAKKFGGGGHKNAAGFMSDRLLHLTGRLELS